MRGRSAISRAGRFARRYLVAFALVAALAASAIEVGAVGTDPAPQGPPSGAVLYAGHAELRWSRGTRGGEIRLQVAPGDPGFAAPSIDGVESGTGKKIEGLEAGKTYYWRLVRDGEPGPVMKLTISRDALGL
jgi:hypothetical protein